MYRAVTAIISTLFIVVGCGGDSVEPTSPPPPPAGGAAALTITTDNAKQAARVAYASAMQSTEAGSQVDGSPVGSNTGSGLQKPAGYEPGAAALVRYLQKVPLGPDTYDCGVSGTQTISGEISNIFDFSGLSAGDRINVEATECDDGLGEVVNGRIEMTVVSFSGDLTTGLYQLEMAVQLIDFEVTTAADSILSNGDATVWLDTMGNPLFEMSVSGSSLTTVYAAGTDVLTDFMTLQTVDASVLPEPYTLSAAGTVDSSRLAGSIDFSTPVTFQGAGATYPYAGELLVTGAGGATVRLIALTDQSVRIETDTDGDGTVDGTEDTTWDDIAS